MDYSTIKTPERCYADFCLIPVSSASLDTLEPPLAAVYERPRATLEMIAGYSCGDVEIE